MELRFPDLDMLDSYVAAVERGWQPAMNRPESGTEELAAIAADPERFVRSKVDLEATGPPVVQPDGTSRPKIPGYHKWMWDGEFCGGISFRWSKPSPDYAQETLPFYVLGHIGYHVVPWKRRRGYATRALQVLLPEAAERGFGYVEITTDEDNIGSRKVIEAAGGQLYETFEKLDIHGGGPCRRRCGGGAFGDGWLGSIAAFRRWRWRAGARQDQAGDP